MRHRIWLANWTRESQSFCFDVHTLSTRSTSETIQNLEEQHVIAKGTQMTKRVMVGGGGGGREEENGASVLCFFWHFLILFVHQSNLSDYSINRKSDACLNGTEFWNTGLLYSFLFVSVIRLRSQHALGIFYSGLWKRLNKIANPNWK